MKSSCPLLCPVCGRPLRKTGQSYICGKGHNFDIAKEGYVNLLLSSAQHAKMHGDNREMIRARRDFLNKEYYRCLQKQLQKTVSSLCCPRNKPVLVDAGCGEGYYTSAMYQALHSDLKEDNFCVYGFDMSKEALRIASKRCSQVHFAVSNLFSMPLSDNSVDLLTELFAPIADREFYRVLKPGGILLLVIPAKKHLFELKQALYDTPYYNEEKVICLKGFSFMKKENVRDKIVLSCQEDIQSLFKMTPYFYHTPVKFIRRLEMLSYLETTIDFDLFFFQKD